MKMRKLKPDSPRVNTLRKLRELHAGLGYIHFGAWSPFMRPYTPRVYAVRAGEVKK
jgi:hypothetical protein